MQQRRIIPCLKINFVKKFTKKENNILTFIDFYDNM